MKVTKEWLEDLAMLLDPINDRLLWENENDIPSELLPFVSNYKNAYHVLSKKLLALYDRHEVEPW